MKRGGCILAIVGVVLLSAGFALFGSSIFKALAAREKADVGMSPGEPADSGPLVVETDRLCQVAISGEVHSTHVKQGAAVNSGLELEYAFPLRYTVFDEAGTVLQKYEGSFASDGGMRESHWSKIDDSGGSEHLERGYEKFAVPAPGRIRVVATFEADSSFGATVENPRLLVYDRVSKHVDRVVGGVALLLVGSLAILVGGMMFIIAALRGSTAAKRPA